MTSFILLLLYPPLLLVFVTSDQTAQVINNQFSDALNFTTEEGSGVEEEGSGNTEVDNAPSLNIATGERNDSSVSFINQIRKRGVGDKTKHPLGSVPLELLSTISLSSLRAIPNYALLGLSRPLNKGSVKTRAEYVTLSLQTNGNLWGHLYQDGSGVWQADFIDNNRVISARRENINLRILLLPPDASSTYNMGVEWVLARDADPLSIIVQANTRRAYKKKTSGVFDNGVIQYLGEADLDNRIFSYAEDNGTLHTVSGAQFDKSVWLLIKTSCSCSCASTSGSFFANIKDFFG